MVDEHESHTIKADWWNELVLEERCAVGRYLMEWKASFIETNVRLVSLAVVLVLPLCSLFLDWYFFYLRFSLLSFIFWMLLLFRLPSFSVITAVILLYWAEGLSEITSLPSEGRGKDYLHTTLPRPHLWEYTGYVVVVVVVVALPLPLSH